MYYRNLDYNSNGIKGQGYSDLLPLPTGNFPKDLQNEWLNFLARFEPYNWYVTLTFKDPVHPEQADRRFRRWIRKLNEYLYGRRYRENGQSVTWVRALEYQRRDVIHFHALLAGENLQRAKRIYWMEQWRLNCYHDCSKSLCDCQAKGEKLSRNGFARIDRYDPLLGARGYISKYILKGGEIDIHLAPAHLRLLDDPGGLFGS